MKHERRRAAVMKPSYNITRVVAGTCLAALLAAQLSVYWLSQGNSELPVSIRLSLAIATIAALAFALVLTVDILLTGRAAPRRDKQALVRWLRGIDVAGEAPPRPASATRRIDAELMATIENLVRRIHAYREKLLIRHQRVQRLLRSVSDVLYHTDRNDCFTWVTDTVADMLGYAAAELEGRPLRDLLADPDTDHQALTRSAQLSRYPARCYRKDGSIAWLLISSRRIDDSDGQAIGTEAVCRDGTRLIETQQALNQEKERAQVTLSSIGDAVITTDAQGDVDYLNARAEQMLGIAAAKALNQPFDKLCHLVDSARNEAVHGLVGECIQSGQAHEWEQSLTLHDRAAHTSTHAVKLTIAPIRDSHSAVAGAVIVLHDVSRLQQISQEMSYQANHDVLTGLPNRRAFERLLAGFLSDEEDSTTPHALCYLDLDQFKLVNDTCGHDAGDEMLCQLTAQLSSNLRAADTLARLGGDEFGLVMRNLSLTDAKTKAESLRSEIDRFRFRWENKLFRLSASIGVAAIDGDAVSATELLRRADTACYLAKEQGRNQVHIYRGDSKETRSRHGDMQRMHLISEALDNDRFTLFAQAMEPLNSSRDSRMGVELLLRIQNDTAQIVSPQNILLTAERYNAAARIDRWVLEHALILIAGARAQHALVDHYSINISGQSISDEYFVDDAREMITASGIDPSVLVFEITETTAVTNTRRAGELIRSLRELGCRFSLDDFGSGLSSFSYLKNLPSDFIKIDGQLVSHILQEPVERAIVESINQVGQAMGLLTVAEHVESRALLDALRTIGVDYVQGYHVARPIPFDELAAQLVQRKPLARSK